MASFVVGDGKYPGSGLRGQPRVVVEGGRGWRVEADSNHRRSPRMKGGEENRRKEGKEKKRREKE